MNTTMGMMDAAWFYLERCGEQYQVQNPESVWLGYEIKKANGIATDQMANEIIKKVKPIVTDQSGNILPYVANI